MTPTNKPLVGLLILDLDNTVWDWFDAWHKSMTVMLEELTAATGIPIEVLKAEIRAVHQARGTTEYSWLLDELPSLQPHIGNGTARTAFDGVLHAQNSARKHATKLYPGVMSTLEVVKSHGVKIVAYTESLSFWTEWRVRRTGLDGVIDILYSSPDHDFPDGESRETVRTLSQDDYGMKKTVHRHVERGIAKPNPLVLQEIIAEHSVPGKLIVYIGDTLDKDVEMAQAVGILDVHAKYGEAHDRPEYKLIRELTHWPASAVEKERSTDPRLKAVPTYSLQDGFFELLDYFDFGRFDANAHLKLWEKSVDVQMHFNDLGWRIRALALTALSFTFAATGVAYASTDSINFLWRETTPAAFVPLLGLLLWFAFWFMDLHWFHRLLYGSVIDGTRLEKLLAANGVAAGLGRHIGDESPMKFWWQRTKMHSAKKLGAFYGSIGVALALTAIGIFFLGAPHSDSVSPEPTSVVNNFQLEIPPAATVVPSAVSVP